MFQSWEQRCVVDASSTKRPCGVRIRSVRVSACLSTQLLLLLLLLLSYVVVRTETFASLRGSLHSSKRFAKILQALPR